MSAPEFDRDSFTRLLTAGPTSATESDAQLLAVVYDELRRIAAGLLRNERTVLDATSLVHRAWLRMIEPDAIDADSEDELRRRFLTLAARSMRRVLIDHARRRDSGKRGGGRRHVTLAGGVASEPELGTADLLDLDAALTKLEEWRPRLARVAELRLLGGLNSAEVGRALGIGESTAASDWALARALLIKHLTE